MPSHFIHWLFFIMKKNIACLLYVEWQIAQVCSGRQYTVQEDNTLTIEIIAMICERKFTGMVGLNIGMPLDTKGMFDRDKQK